MNPDQIYQVITRCYPEKTKFKIDVNLIAGMRSSIDQYDSGDWPSITDHYVGLIARNKMERTVTELKGLFIAAKSEAVMRNREVYLHTVGLTDTKTYTDDWCVIATTEPTINSCTTNNNTLYIVDGHSLSGLNIKRHKEYATIKIDSMNGHPKFNAREGIIIG